jgi:NADH-quinone oxidoreductase subunit E
MNGLVSRYPEEVQRIIAKYPAGQKRSAVMPLLHLAQHSTGAISRQDVAEIAALLEMTTTEIASIIGYYTLYHEQAEGKYRFQICSDMPCALRGADRFLEDLCRELGIRPGETTADGLITVEAVPCLAACDRAPMFQVQTGADVSYYERQTLESAMHLVDELRKKNQEAEA